MRGVVPKRQQVLQHARGPLLARGARHEHVCLTHELRVLQGWHGRGVHHVDAHLRTGQLAQAGIKSLLIVENTANKKVRKRLLIAIPDIRR